MSHLPTRWNALAVALALATMVGCQGVSTGKSNVQSTENPLPGTLSAAPGSVTFGNVQVGTTQSQSNTLSNTGGASLTITKADVSGTGFSIADLTLPLTLSPGASKVFTVVFAPQSPGSASGTLVLTNSDSSTLSVPLSGTAVAAGSLTASPTSFSFASVQIGTQQSQTETLKNTGGENLTISQASVSGAGYSYSGLTLPLTLAPNQSTTFGVAFAPTTAGASSGKLSITISGSSTSLDIALSGTGVTPATLTATPAGLTFTNITVGQNQSQTETVKNTGGVSATISQATVAGTGFSISGITTPVTLTPGQSASFSVIFTPPSAGNFSGNVAIASNASNPTLNVALSGSGITQSQGTLSVSPVNAGSVVVGTSGTQTGTLTATGASVSVTSVSLNGTNPSEFSISGLSFPVTVTTSQPVTFTVTFTPGATGAASASASFASTASNSPSAAALAGTGTAAPVHTVSLSWTASTTSGVTSYNVYRAVFGTSCGSYSNVGSTPSSITAYTDSVVADGTTYCYATTAVDPSGESAYSNISKAVIPAP
jgi:Abnormal spindle-like microcephaly-assoc'd, ASPM-SPD-2-Hydin